MRVTAINERDHRMETFNVECYCTLFELKEQMRQRFFDSHSQIAVKHNGRLLVGKDSLKLCEIGIVDGELIAIDELQYKRTNQRPPSSALLEQDVEIQRQIEQKIRAKNVEQNMEMALEHFPEAFGSVVMLFVECKVNGNPIKAFVDTGAQMTIMSEKCARRCGLMRLLDERFTGTAFGIGIQRIVGRVHLAQLQISTTFLSTSLSVLSEQAFELIIGLDLLRRYQVSGAAQTLPNIRSFKCVVDLTRNLLIVTNGSEQFSTHFLPEREIPGYVKEEIENAQKRTNF